jgi:hypothetical protein
MMISYRTTKEEVTWLGLNDWGVFLGTDERYFYSPQRSDQPWGPPSLLSNGPGVKREADHSYVSVLSVSGTSSWHGA